MNDDAAWDVLRTAAGARTLVEVGVERGLDPGACLAGTGLVPADLEDAQIGGGQELQVARNVVRLLGDPPGLGIEAGRRLTLGNMGIWGFALLTSPTWLDAAIIAVRYLRLSAAFLRPEPEAEGAELRMILNDDHLPAEVRDMLAERDLTAALGLIPTIVGNIDLVRMETRLAGVRAAALAELFPDARIDAGRPRHFFACDAALLSRRLPDADRQAWRACKQQCAALLERRHARTGIAAQVRSRLLADPARMPSMTEVATELHIDPRTVRRRLATEATTFRALVDETQAALATELLTTAGLTIDQVSQRLGYADAATFSRAFRRWTGQSPGGYRDHRAGSPTQHT